jgi:hypothetical protein
MNVITRYMACRKNRAERRNTRKEHPYCKPEKTQKAPEGKTRTDEITPRQQSPQRVSQHPPLRDLYFLEFNAQKQKKAFAQTFREYIVHKTHLQSLKKRFHYIHELDPNMRRVVFDSWHLYVHTVKKTADDAFYIFDHHNQMFAVPSFDFENIRRDHWRIYSTTSSLRS